MTSALEQAGAVREPSEYATISMDRGITGIWTQRSPLRDADVPYLYGKFYSASRFDSLIDGLNRELTAKLTWARRAGSSVFNNNTFPAINSFYSFKRIVNGVEVVRTIADGQDGNVYDATPGGKITVFTKSGGAGKARFLGVNTTLYFTDGVENKKWMQPAGWVSQPGAWGAASATITTVATNLVGQAIAQVVSATGLAVGATIVVAGVSDTAFNGTWKIVAISGTTVTWNGVGPGHSGTGGTITQTAGADLFSSTQYEIGTTVIDANGNIQYLTSIQVGTITNVAVTGGVAILKFNNTSINLTAGMTIIPAGLSGASFLNGQLLKIVSVTTGAPNVVTAAFPRLANYPATNDSGTVTATDVGTPANTGVVAPTWAGGIGGTTVDGVSTWTNYGPPVFDWQPLGPPQAPVLANSSLPTPLVNFYIWQPFISYPGGARVYIIDQNGFIQGLQINLSTGQKLPIFATPPAGSGLASTADGTSVWEVSPWLGTTATFIAKGPQRWQASTLVTAVAAGGPIGGTVCIDTNGNLQMASAGSGSTGGSEPTWNATLNGTTTDSGLTWTNIGAYSPTAFTGHKYGYAFHFIDGSQSSLSPLTPSTNGVLGAPLVEGLYSRNAQCDSILIYRTTDGQPTPLYLTSIPNNPAVASWIFSDYYSDQTLDEFLVSAQSSENTPPPIGMTAPIYHLERIFAIYRNTVVYSNGPGTPTPGTELTGFPPLNALSFPEQPIRLLPVTVNNGGVLVLCTANVYMILGTGTALNPFYYTKYEGGLGINNHDAVATIGSTLYAFTGNSKLVSLDPGAGYVEPGFPIGDQFVNVSTGAGGKIVDTNAVTGALYSPATTFVTWAEVSSGDTGLYVADGAVGWFRYSAVSSPETGSLWSPRAAIVGGTSAVQGIETSPGHTQLLIGPKTSGPILFRDSSVNADWSSGAYATFGSYDVKGNIVLCESGEVAEIAHIGVKSVAVGAKPLVGLLLGELSPTQKAPFDWLSATSCDPPDLPPSQTMYSDRYTALQNGVCPKCDNFQLCIDYGKQNVADELLKFSVYGAKHAERKQQ